jgi:lysophospholipase L1-like esterase
MRSKITPFQNNDTICLVGDSITHSGTYHSHIFLYHATRHPLMRLRFVNCGISGDSASGMLGRLNQDVFPNNATVVTLSAGMNDVGRDLYSLIRVPDDAESRKRSTIDAFKQNIGKISDALAEKGVRQIFITPTIYDEHVESTDESLRGVNAALGECRDFVLELGKARNIPVVDFWHPMNEINRTRQQADSAFTLVGKDRVHPGPIGHLVMAYLFLDQTNTEQDVWRISMDAKANVVLEQKNAEVTDLVMTPAGLTFSSKEMALPFPLIEDAKEALNLVPFIERLNQQVLQIHNLPAGNHTLKINGSEVGTYSHSTFERGVNLAENPAAPQNVLAREIGRLCAEHHSLGNTIRVLRRVEIKDLVGVDLNDREAVKTALDAFVADKLSQKDDPPERTEYYLMLARTYLKEIGNEQAMLARIQAIEEEIYRINQPAAYAYSLEMSRP